MHIFGTNIWLKTENSHAFKSSEIYRPKKKKVTKLVYIVALEIIQIGGKKPAKLLKTSTESRSESASDFVFC